MMTSMVSMAHAIVPALVLGIGGLIFLGTLVFFSMSAIDGMRSVREAGQAMAARRDVVVKPMRSARRTHKTATGRDVPGFTTEAFLTALPGGVEIPVKVVNGENGDGDEDLDIEDSAA